MKLRLKQLLPIIGILLFVYLIFRIGVGEIFSSFSRINIYYIILALLFVPLTVVMQAWKWYAITSRQKIKMGFGEALKIQFVSLFYGFITPARIGTFIKIFYLNDKTKNLGKSVSSVILERLFDMVVVLIFAAFGSIILIKSIANKMFFDIAIWMFSLLLLFISFSFFLISKNIGKRIFKMIYEKLMPKKLKRKTRKGFNGFYNSMPKKRYLIFPFILTIITWFIIYTPNFLIAKALGVNIPYLTFIFLFAIATIVAELPITISGLGVREATLITMLNLFNVEASAVMSLSILSVFIITALPALIGFFFSIHDNRQKVIENLKK